jgi:hypothetical protein
MASGKELGKILSASLGFVDYKFGATFELKLAGSGQVTAFIGAHSRYPKHAQFPIEHMHENQLGAWNRIMDLMRDANVQTFDKLVGKPIEVTLDNNALRDWRILTEVI